MKFAGLSLLLAGLGAAPVAAAPLGALDGTKDIVLHTRDGQDIVLGAVAFTETAGQTHFDIKLDRSKFGEYFLSMVEFKCVEGPEITCHVPYPHPNPHLVSAQDLSWLEHSLLFFTKAPADYGAQLRKGVIYSMKLTPDGIVGTPQSIDLNAIAAPPENVATAPFGPSERYDFAPGERWIQSLTIGGHR